MSKYEELLAAQSATIDAEFEEELNLEEISSKKLEGLYIQCENVTGKPVIEDWYFKSGKLQGLIRHIIQNPKKRTDLLAITGLTETLLRKFDSVSGRLPYQDKKTKKMVEGQSPDIPRLKKLLIYIATKMSILITDEQLNDLTMENWNKIYQRRLESIEKTIESDNRYGGDTLQYEE